jgi:hypothetical protein
MSEIPTPNTLFCPKCGELMKMERITDAQTLAKLEESGYAAGARGLCNCGVTAVLAIKRMPENPTFSLLFNIYKFETIKNKVK